MPKVKIDYSNTIFYKIYCKDPSIKDLYIGHTTNFVQRKHSHKQSCINPKLESYKCKLYKCIRDNLGWDNWTMEIIAFHNCEDLHSAKVQEQYYFEEYKATLNSVQPLPKRKPKKENIIKPPKEVLYCNSCSIYFSTHKLQEEHNKRPKHLKMIQTKTTYDTSIKSPNKSHVYICDKCVYTTANKKDYNKHLLTRKHVRLINTNNIVSKNPHMCECGKEYKHMSSLCKHRSKCTAKQVDDSAISNIFDNNLLTHTVTNNYQCNHVTNEPLNQTELIVELLKQNKEFKDLILEERREFQQIIAEQNKQLSSQNDKMIEMAGNMGNHNTTNSHNNNKFNMNVFLNEKCKDAISLTEFVNSMNLSIEDFVKTGELGFVNGLSSVMIERINSMDLHSRPLHCTDLKRETVYIKDDKKWEKDENKEHLRNAVKRIARKNENMRPVWYHNAPDVDILGSENCEKFLKYSASALGGCGKDQTKTFEDKIMKNILKEVTVDKQMTLI